MVKVIKIGKKRTICKNCDSELEYIETDTYPKWKDNIFDKYIRCPVCERETKIQ